MQREPTYPAPPIERDAILKTLGDGWSICDALFCSVRIIGSAWVWMGEDWRLHLLHADGSRAVVVGVHLPEPFIEWHLLLVHSIAREHAGEVAIREHGELFTVRDLLQDKDGCTFEASTLIGYWPAAKLDIGGLQEQLICLACQVEDIGMFPASADGELSPESERVACELKARWGNATFWGVHAHEDAPSWTCLSMLAPGVQFRVRFYGRPGEYLATRVQDNVSRWGTILCALETPLDGIVTVRLRDTLRVVPRALACFSCEDVEFSPCNREVVLGEPPEQIFTSQCADCFGLVCQRNSFPSHARSIAEIAAPEALEKPAVKHPWDVWANPQWEEP